MILKVLNKTFWYLVDLIPPAMILMAIWVLIESPWLTVACGVFFALYKSFTHMVKLHLLEKYTIMVKKVETLEKE